MAAGALGVLVCGADGDCGRDLMGLLDRDVGPQEGEAARGRVPTSGACGLLADAPHRLRARPGSRAGNPTSGREQCRLASEAIPFGARPGGAPTPPGPPTSVLSADVRWYVPARTGPRCRSGPQLGHESRNGAKTRLRAPLVANGKAPVCSEFPLWRDPDSNRAHHDFQAFWTVLVVGGDLQRRYSAGSGARDDTDTCRYAWFRPGFGHG